MGVPGSKKKNSNKRKANQQRFQSPSDFMGNLKGGQKLGLPFGGQKLGLPFYGNGIGKGGPFYGSPGNFCLPPPGAYPPDSYPPPPFQPNHAVYPPPPFQQTRRKRRESDMANMG